MDGWCVIMLPKYLRSTAYGREHGEYYDDPEPITIPKQNSGVIKLPQLQIFHRVPDDWPNSTGKCIPPLASIFYAETKAERGKRLQLNGSNGSIEGPDASSGRIGMLVDTNMKKVIFTHNTKVVDEAVLTLTPPLCPPAAYFGDGSLPKDGFVFDVTKYISSSQVEAKRSTDDLKNMVSEYLHFYGYSPGEYAQLRKQVRKYLHARNYKAVRELFEQANMPPEVTFELDLLELAETFAKKLDTYQLNQAFGNAHKLLVANPTKAEELQAATSLVLKKGEVSYLKVLNACCKELDRRERLDLSYKPHNGRTGGPHIGETNDPHYGQTNDSHNGLTCDPHDDLPQLYTLFST